MIERLIDVKAYRCFTILISGGVGSIGPVRPAGALWKGEPRAKSIAGVVEDNGR
jgi:hypothetical protein